MWWSVSWSPLAKGFVTSEGTLISPLCCADGLITTYAEASCASSLLDKLFFMNPWLLPSNTSTAEEKAQCDEEWEPGTIAVHSDWGCTADLGTLLCFAVQLQTQGHQAQNLLVNISKVSSWLKGGKSNASHLSVYSLYICMPLFSFLVFDLERRESVKILPLLGEKMGFCSGFSQQAEFFWT